MCALRCQLPRRNPFYAPDPPPPPPADDAAVAEPPHVGVDASIEANLEAAALRSGLAAATCVVCGATGRCTCAGCPQLHYCGDAHRELHRTVGGHAAVCGTMDAATAGATGAGAAAKPLRLPEFELITETEGDASDDSDRSSVSVDSNVESGGESDDSSDADDADGSDRQMHEYHSALRKYGLDTAAAANDGAAELAATIEADAARADPAFSRFQRRTARRPEQVLRYDRGGRPLWISERAVPGPRDVPPCEVCGEAREFECQVRCGPVWPPMRRLAPAQAALLCLPSSFMLLLLLLLLLLLEEVAMMMMMTTVAAAQSSSSPSPPIPFARGAGAVVVMLGARRAQILPQLLFYLQRDSSLCEEIDWGTLAIYTCSRRCVPDRGAGPYLREFLWRQAMDEH